MKTRVHRIDGDVLSAEIEDVGARIRSVVHRRSGRELLLRTRWSTAPPLLEAEALELPWRRRFADGWNVLIPHAGEAGRVAGVRHPYHGEAARRRWSMSGTWRSCTASLSLDAPRLELKRTVSVETRRVIVKQEITNVGRRTESFSWVEHPVFDATLLSETGCIDVASATIPLAREGVVAFDDVEADVGVGEFDIPSLDGRLRLSWDRRILPHAYVWQERRATSGFPWFLDVDGFGIEPASHPSGPPPVGRGPLCLEPAERMSATLLLEFLS